MSRHPPAPEEYYHLYNRGVHKHDIFVDQRDYTRFLFLILHFQSAVTFENISRPVSYFLRQANFKTEPETLAQIISRRTVELISFVLMPNHFHLVIKGVADEAVSNYMHRVGTAYTNYFNTRHQHSGHVFQGKYKMVHIANNNQLIYNSAYIHKNPKSLAVWFNNYQRYPWSSYQDYIKENRWGELLKRSIILEQFKSPKEYADWVRETPAKEWEELAEIFDQT